MTAPQSPFTALQALQEEQREGCVPTPKTDEIMRGIEAIVAEKDAAITDLNQRLIDRQESFTAQIVRIEDAWREKLLTERAEKDAQIVALRDELEGIKLYMQSDWSKRPCDGEAQVINRIQQALSTPAPSCVPLKDVRILVDAAQRIQHWHDAAFNPETSQTEGMIVSVEAVRGLWKNLESFTAKHPQP